MTIASEVNIEAIVEDLLVSENLQAVLSSLDTVTRSAIRLDAMFQIADLVIYEDFAATEFRIGRFFLPWIRFPSETRSISPA